MTWGAIHEGKMAPSTKAHLPNLCTAKESQYNPMQTIQFHFVKLSSMQVHFVVFSQENVYTISELGPNPVVLLPVPSITNVA